MRKVNVISFGLALGGVVGLWHLCWIALVALGWAQAVIDFVFRVHFIQPALHVEPFVPATAAILIVLATAAGFTAGVVLATAWNWLQRRSPTTD